METRSNTVRVFHFHAFERSGPFGSNTLAFPWAITTTSPPGKA
jgi:hypothetical protein